MEAVLGTVALLVLALVAQSHGSDGLAIGLTVLGGCAALFLWRRPRLEVGPEGLRVVNFARSYRIPWTDIAALGYGSGRMVPSLSIQRRDGTVVNAVVVTDDARAGYSSERVHEIIGDLEERLAAETGMGAERTLDVSDEPPARRFSGRVNVAVWVAVCLFFVVFGAVTAWTAASDLPRTYSRLSSQGVRASAVFAGCRVTGIRHHECRLSLTYGGRMRTWNYAEDFPQFRGLAVGAPVAVLVDAKHPTTVYTVHDVDVRYDAGFSPLAIFGIVLAVLGLLGLVSYLWLRRRAGATR